MERTRVQRARRLGIAGFATGAQVETNLAEWDNGLYEGRTSADIRAQHPGWNLFRHGCPGGESPDQISLRVDQLIQTLLSLEGNVALFTHGHLSRVLVTRWLGLPIAMAEHFMCGTASLSILDYHRDKPDVRVVALWNSGTATLGQFS